MKYRITLKSRNTKTGPMPVTTTSRDSCPNACPLKDSGCYADSGPLRLVWNGVDKTGLDIDAFASAIAALPENQIWRHNQAGDLPGDGRRINRRELSKIVTANKGKRGFTYTHYPPNAGNAEPIRRANAEGFTINLSANNLAHADSLLATKAGPVASIVPIDFKDTHTPGGTRVVVCPATYRNDVSCMSCQLCQRHDRRVVVAFPAHGTSKGKADAISRESI